MNAGFHSRTFDALLRKLRDKHASLAPPTETDLLSQFVHAYLLWEAQADDAERALARVAKGVVDFNELRVCLVDEIVQMLGVRYPKAQERAQRMKSSLHDVFVREHAVTFDHLRDKNKRVARQYLETLDAIPPFVAARMMAVGLAGHAVPLDERMLAKLVGAEAFDEDTTLDRAVAALERHIKADDALETHLLLIAGCEDGGGITGSRKSSKPRAKTPARNPRKTARRD